MSKGLKFQWQLYVAPNIAVKGSATGHQVHNLLGIIHKTEANHFASNINRLSLVL